MDTISESNSPIVPEPEEPKPLSRLELARRESAFQFVESGDRVANILGQFDSYFGTEVIKGVSIDIIDAYSWKSQMYTGGEALEINKTAGVFGYEKVIFAHQYLTAQKKQGVELFESQLWPEKLGVQTEHYLDITTPDLGQEQQALAKGLAERPELSSVVGVRYYADKTGKLIKLGYYPKGIVKDKKPFSSQELVINADVGHNDPSNIVATDYFIEDIKPNEYEMLGAVMHSMGIKAQEALAEASMTEEEKIERWRNRRDEEENSDRG